jgi:hypothetical protein
VDIVSRLRAAVDLRPGLDDAGLAELQARYPVPLPAELVRLARTTSGAEGLLDLDLTGVRHDVEVAELLPAGLPVAADGNGNFWVLDLTPDTVEVAPVFFVCHDPPVMLYQAPDLATFLDDALRRLEPPHRSAIDDVREDRLHDVWGSSPGAISHADAVASTDVALREFAETLHDEWTIVDLRQRDVGAGLAWGRHGPRTRLARDGWERMFGYAPHVRPRRTWRRFGRRARV